MGGPNVRKKKEGIKQYLYNHPSDLYVINEGEDAFATIIEHVVIVCYVDWEKSDLRADTPRGYK